MSAFVQSKDHIDALLRVGLQGPAGRTVSPDNAWHKLTWHAANPYAVTAGASDHADYFRKLATVRRELTFETVDSVGAMLTAENVRSVQYRYGGESMDTLPGPVDNGFATDALLGTYRYPMHGTGAVPIAPGPRRLSAIEALKALDGYEYQSCERPEWRDTEAYRFCEALRSALINALPGYDKADTWSI